MKDPLRKVGETRGFAATRLLTHWAEVAGPELATKTRPVKISYGREGLGATLTLLVRAAEAPIVQMQLPALKERVNAAYGYAAVAHIHLTQTSSTGFAEGQAEFSPALKPFVRPDPALQARAREQADGVADPVLRSALEQLAQNILTRPRK
ncbi:MAG TPA: DciA family protein [Tabrizicola sp.]|nr:DciA family protein [Tabrizicola sp.]